MKVERERLLRLAAAVLDGAEIDWEKEESASGGEEERRLIRQLRHMAKFARVGRDSEATDDPSGSGAKGAVAGLGEPGRLSDSGASTEITAHPHSAPGM